MQSCYEGRRCVHPDLGGGVVVQVMHESTRGLPGADTSEALVRFDSGGLMCVSIDDLRDENDDDRVR